MLLKQDIAYAYAAQKKEQADVRPWTLRMYLKNLNTEDGHIEVISGIRRCGKAL